MKFKKSLVGAVLVLALAGGGFATMAAASTSAPSDAPELGKVGQTADTLPPGVTLESAEAGVPAR